MKIASRMSFDQIDWSKFKYMAFDIPNHQGTFKERYEILARLSELKLNLPSFFAVAPKIECEDRQHLEKILQDIVDNGGEGIILRNPSTPYEAGRSPGFLKHKVLRIFLFFCFLFLFCF
jgi:DNA ligase 1